MVNGEWTGLPPYPFRFISLASSVSRLRPADFHLGGRRVQRQSFPRRHSQNGRGNRFDALDRTASPGAAARNPDRAGTPRRSADREPHPGRRTGARVPAGGRQVTDLAWLTVAEAAELLRGRKLSPVEYAKALIAPSSGTTESSTPFCASRPTSRWRMRAAPRRRSRAAPGAAHCTACPTASRISWTMRACRPPRTRRS